MLRATLFCLVIALSLPCDAESIDTQEIASLIVEKTNAFREREDLRPVQVDKTLQQTAKSFADFMANNDKYGHYADGRTPAERAKAEGYKYCVVRENIAYVSNPRQTGVGELAEHFTQGWIDSPEHRENMLADYVTETGVAVSSTDGVTFYAVQLFGRPKSKSYRVSLTNETDETRTVQIESNGGSDEIDLPPRGKLRMRRCFPITLSIPKTEASAALKQSADVVIRDGDKGPRFDRSSAK